MRPISRRACRTLAVSASVMLAVTGPPLRAGAAVRHRSALPPPVPCPSCWQPALNTSWQWQLQGTPDGSLGVQMYDADMFDTSASTVASLHSAGAHVICYVDAGTWENWRPDRREFPFVGPGAFERVAGGEVA